jgi:ethanolamine utilization protein EutP (predicted NTPase)
VSKEQQALAATEPELSPPHLQLCLNLELPLVIVITKYDLAKLGTLRQTLSRLLTALKEAGRKPHIIKDPAASALDTELRFISATDLHEADEIVKSLAASPLAAVPIILTSAVNGTGITKLHAFLRKLPIPPHPDKSLRSSPSSPSSLFYIEDIYSVQANASSNRSAIIGGYLRFGNLNVGDEFLLGPYPGDTSSDDSDSGSGRRPSRTQIGPQSRSFPGAFKNSHGNNLATLDRHAEWRRVRITSLRNLRVPVSTLRADQVGTMCIAPVDTPILSPAINRIRKGMVLANPQPKASKVITVRFEGAQAIDAQNLSIGSAVEVYIASVRASSKVMSVVTETGAAGEDPNDKDEDDSAFGFGFDDDVKEESGSPTPSATRITFQFSAREFVEIGAKVLVLPGGGPGLSSGNEKGAKGHAGLDGFVGRVVEE